MNETQFSATLFFAGAPEAFEALRPVVIPPPPATHNGRRIVPGYAPRSVASRIVLGGLVTAWGIATIKAGAMVLAIVGAAL